MHREACFPKNYQPLVQELHAVRWRTLDKRRTKGLTVRTTTELLLGRDFSKAYEPRVVGMPSEGSVLIESCKQSVGVEICAALDWRNACFPP